MSPEFVKVTISKTSTAQSRSPNASRSRQSASRLLVCLTGICASFLYFGVLQERLLTGELGLAPTFTLVTGCLTNAVVALIWQRTYTRLSSRGGSRNKTRTNSRSEPLPLYHGLLLVTSTCYILGMVTSNEAIRYVSYPVTVLAKSCKLVPTMLAGHFVENRMHSTHEWLSVALIAVGGVQMLRHSIAPTSSMDMIASHDTSLTGVWLLVASLALDGILSSCLNVLRDIDPKKYRYPTAAETMLLLNLYGLVLLIPFTVWNLQWDVGISTLAHSAREHQRVVWDLLIMNVVAGIGQIFVFLLASWFSPYLTTIVTTTRKFFTILLSVWMFGHIFSRDQWAAIATVFCGLYLVSLGHQRGSSAS